jgi:hypothetical protein
VNRALSEAEARLDERLLRLRNMLLTRQRNTCNTTPQ